MLHEILLSLSGHPSPILRIDDVSSAYARAGISPAERDLLSSIAHLSDLHIKLLSYVSQVCASHPSMVSRAVATTIELVHLAEFQRKVLEVESTILREDAELVGAYSIVSLTAVVAEFTPWTRRMEWLWEVVQYMLKGGAGGEACTAPQLIGRLRKELQSGYVDIEETARSLVRSAEMAWLKQASAWILYGRLPTLEAEGFFIRTTDGENESKEYILEPSLLPSFVLPSTAASMLFIGKSLNHPRVRATLESGARGRDHVSAQLRELSRLTFPLESPSFSKAINSIRLSLSRNTLQDLLPLERVVEILQLFRDYFLLAKGEFAMTLTQEADEKSRNRWRRADNLAYEQRDGLSNVAVKQGEVTRVLARTWVAMGSMQGLHSEEDEGIELARDLLRLHLTKSKPATPLVLGSAMSRPSANTLATTPFRNLLFSVPVVLTLSEIPSPLDMFLSNSDLQIYTVINSYLLSIRRAHIRLTDLWKMTSLRRHYPAPPGPPLGSTRAGREQVVLLRNRHAYRSSVMRSAWVTCSAAAFFFAETEAYMQSEVVAGLWDDFNSWLAKGDTAASTASTPKTSARGARLASSKPDTPGSGADDEDIWLDESPTSEQPGAHQPAEPHATPAPRDPESLSTAHRTYLRSLSRHLLLTQTPFTEALYSLLVSVDHLVATVHRLHSTWSSMDLETDAGVLDAFSDLEADEKDIIPALRGLEESVRCSIGEVIESLRELELNSSFAAELEGDGDLDDDGAAFGGDGYVPRRIGGINRLLMKLDFGGWIGQREDAFADS
ncbi:related to gamma-tubulin complex component GCP4 [Cephalotrichum gorgonifer]|uniref:Spindle pole body component n=1 Tax=Cephalotrichum gorgonifer TaxID=2041049 RepID=A0AAE8N3X2_9PEZI|nr:related to gamma-tubulin complex component GCP4 [Cephalotrichum gorgonifer]